MLFTKYRNVKFNNLKRAKWFMMAHVSEVTYLCTEKSAHRTNKFKQCCAEYTLDMLNQK